MRRSLIAGAAASTLARPAFAGKFFIGRGGVVPTAAPNSIGSAGRAFPTPEAWIASLPSVIPFGTPYTGLMYADSLFTSTGIVFPSSIDTSAWNGSGQPAIILTTAPGQSFKDNAIGALAYNAANGVAIDINATLNGRAITVGIQNVAIRNIQVHCSNGNRVINTDPGGASGGIYLDNMIIHGNTMSNLVSGTNNVITNCLLIQSANIPSSDGSATIFDGSLSVGGAVFRYCTIVQYSNTTPSDYDIWNTVGESGHPTVITNCALFGSGQVVQTGLTTGGGITSTTSATDSPAMSPIPAPGLITGLSYTAQFNGTLSSAPDFRLTTGSALRNAGTPVSGVTTDIFGQARNPTTPCVGCFEHA